MTILLKNTCALYVLVGDDEGYIMCCTNSDWTRKQTTRGNSPKTEFCGPARQHVLEASRQISQRNVLRMFAMLLVKQYWERSKPQVEIRNRSFGTTVENNQRMTPIWRLMLREPRRSANTVVTKLSIADVKLFRRVFFQSDLSSINPAELYCP